MDIDLPNVLAEIDAVFTRYEQALVTNDIDTLNDLFWNDARTLRFGVSENLYGYDAITAFRTSRVTHNLQRAILKKHLTTFGTDFATAHIEFQRADGEIGRQTQIWIRFPQGWKIVGAHVSKMA